MGNRSSNKCPPYWESGPPHFVLPPQAVAVATRPGANGLLIALQHRLVRQLADRPHISAHLRARRAWEASGRRAFGGGDGAGDLTPGMAAGSGGLKAAGSA